MNVTLIASAAFAVSGCLAALFCTLWLSARDRAAEAVQASTRYAGMFRRSRQELVALRGHVNGAYQNLFACRCDAYATNVPDGDTPPPPVVPVSPGRLPEPTADVLARLEADIHRAFYRGDDQ